MRLAGATLAAALCATAAAGQPQMDPSSLRTVVMKPVGLADAIAEFERVCLATGFSHDRFAAAIAASKWRFRTEQGAGTPTPDVRRAPQAVFGFHAAPAQEARSFAPGQCNMEFVLSSPAEPAAVLAALDVAVARGGGAERPRYEFPGESCWRWMNAESRVNRLCLLHWPGARSAHVALSFQLWTQEGERRARLVPPAGKAER